MACSDAIGDRTTYVVRESDQAGSFWNALLNGELRTAGIQISAGIRRITPLSDPQLKAEQGYPVEIQRTSRYQEETVFIVCNPTVSPQAGQSHGQICYRGKDHGKWCPGLERGLPYEGEDIGWHHPLHQACDGDSGLLCLVEAFSNLYGELMIGIILNEKQGQSLVDDYAAVDYRFL